MKFIQANIRHLRTSKGYSQEQIAEELGWTRSMIGSYEEGRSEPSIDRLIALSNYFDIPIDILVKNDLRIAKDTSFIEVGNKRVLFPITVNEINEDLIDIVPAKASAGYMEGYADPEYIEQLEKIKLPFLPTGTHRAFPIKGDSMLPVKELHYFDRSEDYPSPNRLSKTSLSSRLTKPRYILAAFKIIFKCLITLNFRQACWWWRSPATCTTSTPRPL